METKIPRAPFAAVIIKLLQGPVYADDKNIWRELQAWSSAIQEYFGKIGMTLEIAEQDGFARIIQPEAGESDETPLPRLMRKQSLMKPPCWQSFSGKGWKNLTSKVMALSSTSHKKKLKSG
jgi:hypothetical protein